MRNIHATPARMVEANRSIHIGTFRTPFRQANILDAPLYPFPAPGFWKNFRLKEWQHYGIVTPSHYFGVVIFDAKFTGVSFFYAYDRQNNTRFEYARQGGGKDLHIAAQVYDDFCRFDAPGYHIRFENKLDAGYHHIFVDIEGDKKRPAVNADVTVYEDLKTIEPLVQVSPITVLRPLYTHKAAAPASGGIRLGSREIALERNNCIVLLDEQKTYYPYFSFWKWSTAAGFADDGRIMAFNVCQNMITDDQDHNENCFWNDGKIHCLKAARFEFGDVMKPWKVRTTDDAFNVSFTPQGERAKRLSQAGGLIFSDFHQPFGLYGGSFTDGKGVRHPIRDFFGLAEHHVTRY